MVIFYVKESTKCHIIISFSHYLNTCHAETGPLLQKTPKDFGLSRANSQNLFWKGKTFLTNF